MKGNDRHGSKVAQLKWDEAASVLENHIPGLSTPALIAVLNCWREGKYGNEQLLEKMLSEVRASNALASSLDGSSLYKLIRNLTQVKGPMCQLRLEIIVEGLQVGLDKGWFAGHDYDAKQIANTMYNTGLVVEAMTGSVAPAKEALTDIVHGMVEEFCKKAGMDCKPVYLSKALQGFADIGTQDEVAAEKLCRVLQINLANFGIFGCGTISSILSSLSKLDNNNKDLLGLIGQHAKFAAPDLTPQQLSDLIHGFAGLRFGRNDILGPLAKELSRKHNLEELTHPLLARTVYDLGLLKLPNEDILLLYGDEIVKEYRLPYFTSSHLASIVLGFGMAKCYNASLFALLMGKVVADFEHFQLHELSDMAYGVGLVRTRIIHDKMSLWVTKFLELFASQLQETGVGTVDLDGVSRLIWSYGIMGYVDEALFSIFATQVCNQVTSGVNLTPQHVYWILQGHARVCYKSSKLLQPILSNWTAVMLPSLDDPQVVARLLQSKALLNDLSPTEYKQICDLILDLESKGASIEKEIIQAALYGSMHVVVCEGVKPHRGILDLIRFSNRGAQEGTIRRTRLLRDVVKALKEMGLKHALDEKVFIFDEGHISVDVFLEGNGEKYALFCDGIQHYSLNQPNGEYVHLGWAAFRNKLMTALGYKVYQHITVD